MKQVLYSAIAHTLEARRNCIKAGNDEWLERHEDRLYDLEQELPSGSGFDAGTKILIDECKPDRIVLHTSFHHMSEHGYYDGWTKHEVWIVPSLIGKIDVKVKGRDRNEIKEYIAETLYATLMEEANA